MTRVKRGVISAKRRRNVLAMAKGFRHGRKSKERLAKEQLAHSYNSAFRDRRDKKNNFRRLWTVKINAEVRNYDLSYSRFIDLLKKKNIIIDRKILAELAQNSPEVFAKIVEMAKA